MISLRDHRSYQALTMVEVLVVIVILGIVMFLTLPNLSQNKTKADRNASIAKVISLNQAKETFIATRGMQTADSLWGSAVDDEARYTLLRPYMAGTTAATLATYTVPGYLISFEPNYVTFPAILIEDINLDGIKQLNEPKIAYQ